MLSLQVGSQEGLGPISLGLCHTKYGLNLHRERHRNVPAYLFPVLHSCIFCEPTFPSLEYLVTHMVVMHANASPSTPDPVPIPSNDSSWRSIRTRSRCPYCPASGYPSALMHLNLHPKRLYASEAARAPAIMGLTSTVSTPRRIFMPLHALAAYAVKVSPRRTLCGCTNAERNAFMLAISPAALPISFLILEKSIEPILSKATGKSCVRQSGMTAEFLTLFIFVYNGEHTHPLATSNKLDGIRVVLLTC